MVLAAVEVVELFILPLVRILLLLAASWLQEEMVETIPTGVELGGAALEEQYIYRPSEISIELDPQSLPVAEVVVQPAEHLKEMEETEL